LDLAQLVRRVAVAHASLDGLVDRDALGLDVVESLVDLVVLLLLLLLVLAAVHALASPPLALDLAQLVRRVAVAHASLDGLVDRDALGLDVVESLVDLVVLLLLLLLVLAAVHALASDLCRVHPALRTAFVHPREELLHERGGAAVAGG